MPYTGQLGTKNSQLGNIVLGVASLQLVDAFDHKVHQLTANKARVKFTRKVDGSALDVSRYVLTSLAAPGTAITPTLISVEFFDATRQSVELTFARNLTTGTDYSMTVDGVCSELGESMALVTKNFTANVVDPPRALGAFQSKRGALDVVFDRSVGPTSAAAVVEIRDASLPGPGAVMPQLPWAAEDIAEDTLRFDLPGGTPTADAFELDFTGILDSSLNEGTGTVPVTLALRSGAPYSLADIGQLQIVDASVIGVSDDLLGFGIVRVYFNGPTADSSTTGNWDVFMEGPHPKEDAGNDVTAPDAFDLPSLLTLLADFKASFNAHLTEPFVHVTADAVNAITLADPVDETAAVAFINDAQAKLNAHFDQLRVHTYPDEVNGFSPLTAVVGDLALSNSIANNLLKANFNAHLEPEFELPNFVPVWSGAINRIESWDRLAAGSNRNHGVRSPYSLYADLHVQGVSPRASVRLEATVLSEDGGSSTTPMDFTGSFVARALSAPPVVLSSEVLPDERVRVVFDKEMVLPGPDDVDVRDSSGRSVGDGTYRLTSSIPDAQRALKHVMNAYRWHISAGNTGAGHQISDGTNLVSVAQAPNLPTLQSLVDAANSFKQVLNDHMGNVGGEWHLHADPRPVRASDASDLESALALVDDLVRTFLRHNGRVERNESPHFRPGFRVFNAPVRTNLLVPAPSMLDGDEHRVTGPVRGTWFENVTEGGLGVGYPGAPATTMFPGAEYFNRVALDVPFTGLATRPSLASACPRSGLVLRDDGVRFESDAVEVFFSKPMRQVPLDAANLPVTGGSTLQKEASWVDPSLASVRVVNMTAVPHSVVAVGLTDLAGNPVY